MFTPGDHFAPETCYRHRCRLELANRRVVPGANGLVVEYTYACPDDGGYGFTKTYHAPFDYGEEAAA